MIKKIPTAFLQIGMYVVDTGLEWTEYPLLYAEEGIVTSAEQASSIASEYRDVFVDTSLGSYEWKEQDRKNAEESIAEDAARDGGVKPRYPVPISLELNNAKCIYDDSIAFAKGFMTEAMQDGVIDYERSTQFVEDVMGSVTRNPDALVSLTKLRSFDEYTYTHCVNVTVLAMAFGNYMGLPESELHDLGIAALFHDVGKALIPGQILNKPGRLTDAEFLVMKKHPERSQRLLHKRQGIPQHILRAVSEHHEKYDGTGYPRGIGADDVHPMARIIAVVDVYDALTSRRVYKDPMPLSKALTILYEMRGRDFHPGYAEKFIKFLGIYPVGSVVRLNSGQYAVVCASNPSRPLRPVIIMACEKDMTPSVRLVLDLSLESASIQELSIVSGADHETLGIDPTELLKDCSI